VDLYVFDGSGNVYGPSSNGAARYNSSDGTKDWENTSLFQGAALDSLWYKTIYDSVNSRVIILGKLNAGSGNLCAVSLNDSTGAIAASATLGVLSDTGLGPAWYGTISESHIYVVTDQNNPE